MQTTVSNHVMSGNKTFIFIPLWMNSQKKKKKWEDIAITIVLRISNTEIFNANNGNENKFLMCFFFAFALRGRAHSRAFSLVRSPALLLSAFISLPFVLPLRAYYGSLCVRQSWSTVRMDAIGVDMRRMQMIGRMGKRCNDSNNTQILQS